MCVILAISVLKKGRAFMMSRRPYAPGVKEWLAVFFIPLLSFSKVAVSMLLIAAGRLVRVMISSQMKARKHRQGSHPISHLTRANLRTSRG